ncbi:hypothetical protein AAE478_001632 [Parahypoxylon ruwenzoriense]
MSDPSNGKPAGPSNGKPAGGKAKPLNAGNEIAAVDDNENWVDEDEEFDSAKKTMAAGRNRHRYSNRLSAVQKRVPFSFHPNSRPLTISDLESCKVLENEAFTDPAHRCSKEKFEYRLSACSEICFGIFCTVLPDDAEKFEINTFPASHIVETSRGDGARSVLIAHIVSTRSYGPVVTDATMDYPRDFRTQKPNTSGLGHDEGGRTICIHSLAVHPKLQACGLGRLIMKSYLQHIKSSASADRCALICQDYLIDYYKSLGFRHLGPSEAGFGGGGWHDMALNFSHFSVHMPEIKI